MEDPQRPSPLDLLDPGRPPRWPGDTEWGWEREPPPGQSDLDAHTAFLVVHGRTGYLPNGTDPSVYVRGQRIGWHRARALAESYGEHAPEWELPTALTAWVAPW